MTALLLLSYFVGMQLRTYRKTHGLRLSDIAQMLADAGMRATHAMTVSRHEKGQREPDIATMEAYRRITKNAVTFEDWAALSEKTGREKPRLTKRRVDVMCS